ncbi:hypothetical protein GDO86_008154 [Hymenochirus boettgeri]|uniref:Protein kinase domain-containing protein n=1 Tax=Hymenochirus boettgeri TaxID=247094 RepID=A0A8T2IWL3_9PIPI|nr:hypothetical protein GDO86_008154 [Hymenochirus boettgeri]
MSKQDSLATCLAKMYERKFEHSTGNDTSKKQGKGGNNMDNKLNLLNEKMDKLLHIQEEFIGKLESVYHNMDMLEKGIDMLKVYYGPTPITNETGLDPIEEIPQTTGHDSCSDCLKLLKIMHKDSLVFMEKLDSLEKMVFTMDKVLTFVGSTLKNSKILDLILKGTAQLKKETNYETKDVSEEKETKTKQDHAMKPAQGQRLSEDMPINSTLEDSKEPGQKTTLCYSPAVKLQSIIQEGYKVSPLQTSKIDIAQSEKAWSQKSDKENDREKRLHDNVEAKNNPAKPIQGGEQRTQQEGINPGKMEESFRSGSPLKPAQTCMEHLSRTDTSEQMVERSCQAKPNHAMSIEELSDPGNGQSKDTVKHKSAFHGFDISQEVIAEDKQPFFKTNLVKEQKSSDKNTVCIKRQKSSDKKIAVQQRSSTTTQKQHKEDNEQTESIQKKDMDDCPPPPAPFNHRMVSIKQAILSSFYSVCQNELLGGGRFGQVHKCVEKVTGLQLAAKIIKVKGAKDRDEVKNEINVMNQLNHVNLIQLYDAFECKNDLTLIMEYLDGGELFDRITDENYHLTELDAIMFTRQICEGIYYLHQQYILHLDLKPENILCVNRSGNQIKIIDFGLARRYKPREKLKVNFGTPEFLAPEVVNYDFVSFPTDMWSVGVITYMLLSVLSPFLGESDAETMNYIVNCNWEFDSETFEQVSDEAKDFISNLLIREKSCRLSAGQCLKHDWLVNLPIKAKKHKVRFKSQVLLQKYTAQRKWKKHFYVVAAANRLKKFQSLSLKPS